jgi:hypothetical protein
MNNLYAAAITVTELEFSQNNSEEKVCQLLQGKKKAALDAFPNVMEEGVDSEADDLYSFTEIEYLDIITGISITAPNIHLFTKALNSGIALIKKKLLDSLIPKRIL